MEKTSGEAFREMAARLNADPADGAGLIEATLTMSALFTGSLNMDNTEQILEELTEIARSHLTNVDNNRATAEALVQALHKDAGFKGNRNGYYDPKNSFLEEVLIRRTGIPISLAVVYVEVARRLNLPLTGVSFPGHFLTRFWAEESPAETVWIDAFEGQVLENSECEARWKAIVPGIPFSPGGIGSANVHDFLLRMLGNLKQIYLKSRDPAFSLACCDALIELQPDNKYELRDRGLLYEQLGRPSLARQDLEEFLNSHPDDETAGPVKARLSALIGQKEQLN